MTLLLCLFLIPWGETRAEGDLRLSHSWWLESANEGVTTVVVAIAVENSGGEDIANVSVSSSETVFILCNGEPIAVSGLSIGAGTRIEHQFSLRCLVDPQPLLWGQPLMFRFQYGESDRQLLSTLERSR